jgi:phage antirepressor YoqD-like protein
MNELTKINNSCIAMTTKEIADIAGRRNDNVYRDAEKMLIDLERDLTKFEGIYKDSYGRDQKCYILDKKLSLCLVAKYDTKTRMAIIDRWEELEAKKQALPETWQGKALYLAENLIEMNKQIESQKPAVEFCKKFAAASGSFKIGDFAKILYDKNSLVIGQNRLFSWLYSNKYLIDSRTPYQKWMDQGLFEVVSGLIDGSNTGRVWKMVKVTGKGMVHLTEKIIESGEFESAKVFK